MGCREAVASSAKISRPPIAVGLAVRPCIFVRNASISVLVGTVGVLSLIDCLPPAFAGLQDLQDVSSSFIHGLPGNSPA